jgi:site-specific recombinase XerD
MGKRADISTTEILDLWPSFARSLRAQNKSPKTERTYGEAVRGLAEFLRRGGIPASVASIRRADVEAYIEDLLSRWKPSTANNRYRGLQQFFRWCVQEGEVPASPMANMRPPRVPESPPPILSPDALRQLIGTCSGPSLADRRDRALLLTFIDNGGRVGEIVAVRLDAVDLDEAVIRVLGKGGRPRDVPLGRAAVEALDRYLRARRRHPLSDTPWVWLGKKGRMTDSGVRQMVRRRAERAGLRDRVHPHLFRGTSIDNMLAAGMSEGDVMTIVGHRSPAMVRRYAARRAVDRARSAFRQASPADRLLERAALPVSVERGDG